MKQTLSLVLSVLRLLTPQELKRLAQDHKVARTENKMAAGAELLIWDDAPAKSPPPLKIVNPTETKQEPQERSPRHQRPPVSLTDDEAPPKAQVLAFPTSGNPLSNIGIKSAAQERAEQEAALARAKENEVSETDFLLEEREKFKDTEDRLHKQCGLASYQRSSDLGLFRVIVVDPSGKERSQLTSSQGVLVNKKQD